jgi:glycine cleavage system regulatory protein
MAKTFVLTFIADDRPGLVERLSETIAAEGGNWLESRMAHLAEKFAGIARIEISDANVSSLKDALTALDEKGFHLTVSSAEGSATTEGHQFEINLEGLDHQGIVRDISHCLKTHGASIEEMETETQDVPMSGGTLFRARVRVRLPAGLSEEDLRNSLELLSGALMVDITLGEVSG